MTSETRCWCGHHKRYHGGDSCTFCDKRRLNEPHSFAGAVTEANGCVVTRTQGGVVYKSLEARMEGGAFGDVPFPKEPSKPRRLPPTSSKIIPYRPSEFSETVTKDDVLEAERATRARRPLYDGSGKWLSEYHWKRNNYSGFDLYASVILTVGGLIVGIVVGIWAFIVGGHIAALIGCPVTGFMCGLGLGALYDGGLEKNYREKKDWMYRTSPTEPRIETKIIECRHCYADNQEQAEFCSNCGQDL